MLRLIVLSDTHGNMPKLRQLAKTFCDYDFVFHLGDYARDIKEFEEQLGDKLISVKGNCDFGGEPAFLQLEEVKIMAVHGNKYGVKSTLNRLFLSAKEQGCSLVLYGHTHCAIIINEDGVTMVNPGSMERFSKPTYAVIEIDGNKINAKIENLA